MSFNFCKGCFHYIKEEKLDFSEKCMNGIIPYIDKDRMDCNRNQRNSELLRYNGTVLLSIKPRFVDLIFSGIKLMEFRRKIWIKQIKQSTKAVIYESTPISMIVGEFSIGLIEFNKIDTLWNKYSNVSGLEKLEFENYFKNLEKGYAIEILNPIKYSKAKICNFGIPQNFIYLTYENSQSH
jgi:predicted transcriptional regulator